MSWRWYKRTGRLWRSHERCQIRIILRAENYDRCVAFYRDLFDLPELYSKEDGDFRLTCLGLGDAYLMIETGGTAAADGKGVAQNPTKLRFNVEDIAEAHTRVVDYGIQTEVIETTWGSILNIDDPDGNPVSIRDDEGFRADLEGR